MCVDEVLKRPEDPFPHVFESVTYGKSQNVVNAMIHMSSLKSVDYLLSWTSYGEANL